MQAGLGGGSSDGAATLLGLLRAWKLRIPEGDLAAIAARLGSDVPYFLVGGTALGLGRGEEVYPLDRPASHVGRAGHAEVWHRHEGRLCLVGRGTWDRTPVSIANSFTHKKMGLTRFFSALALGNDLETPVMARSSRYRGPQEPARGSTARSRRPCRAAVPPCSALFRSEASAGRAARAIRRPDADDAVRAVPSPPTSLNLPVSPSIV